MDTWTSYILLEGWEILIDEIFLAVIENISSEEVDSEHSGIFRIKEQRFLICGGWVVLVGDAIIINRVVRYINPLPQNKQQESIQ